MSRNKIQRLKTAISKMVYDTAHGGDVLIWDAHTGFLQTYSQPAKDAYISAIDIQGGTALRKDKFHGFS